MTPGEMGGGMAAPMEKQPRAQPEDEALYQQMGAVREQAGAQIDRLEYELRIQRRLLSSAQAAIDMFERDEPMTEQAPPLHRR